MLQCVAVCRSVLRCVAVCCSVLQCAAVCRSVLQRAAVCCSVLQCAAVCCSVLQCMTVCCSVLQRAAVCCSVLQCAAVCCSVSQCFAVYYSVFYVRVSSCTSTTVYVTAGAEIAGPALTACPKQQISTTCHKRALWRNFSAVSSLINLLCKISSELTFENFNMRSNLLDKGG